MYFFYRYNRYLEVLLSSYKDVVLNVNGVEEVKNIKARNYGSNAVIDITLIIKAQLKFEQAHAVATQVEIELKKIPDVYEVHVHYEPHPTSC